MKHNYTVFHLNEERVSRQSRYYYEPYSLLMAIFQPFITASPPHTSLPTQLVIPLNSPPPPLPPPHHHDINA